MVIRDARISNTGSEVEGDACQFNNMPMTDGEPSLTWSGYNSLVADNKSVDRVCVLPLIPASPTDKSTQLTFMRRLEPINTSVMGSDTKVVVTMDMALYKPIKQLQMAKADCQSRWLLKPGELHVIIAQMRTIGAYIKRSGIPELWVECGLYGSATTSQILDGKHIRRAVEAHITTASSLHSLLLAEFIAHHPERFEPITQYINQSLASISSDNVDAIKESHTVLMSMIRESNLAEELKKFSEKRHNNHLLFAVACTYKIHTICQISRLEVEYTSSSGIQ